MHFLQTRCTFVLSSPPLSFYRVPLTSCTPQISPTLPPGRSNHKRISHVFLDHLFTPGEAYPLPASELSHLRARRVKPGTPLTLFNSAGDTAHAILQAPNVHIQHVFPPRPQPCIRAIIGHPKSSSRADWAVEKLTELGASSITYAICDRTIAAPTDARLSRWRRLAVSAAKQSLRRDIPTVHTAHFEAVVAEVRAHAAALVFVSGGVHVLDQDVVSRVEDADGALLVVGPEGGFSDQEIDSLIVAGGLCVGLGGGRLRVETAVVTAAAVVAMILATIET